MNAIRPDVLDALTHPRTDVALEHGAQSVDFTALALEVGSFVAFLRERGVRPGDRVVVTLPNSVTSVVAFLACAALGAVWVGVNPSAPAEERARQCEVVSPRLVIGADALTTSSDGLASIPERPELDAPCAIAFSSGTTGPPKALVHTRGAVSLAAAALAATTVRVDDRVGVTLPCSILNVMIVGPLTSLIAGATTVIVDGFTARDVAAACRRKRLTMVRALVPATVYDLVHDDGIAPASLATLREAGTGAAGLAENLRDAFEAKFGIRMSGSYGLSEAPAAVCSEDTTTPRRPGSSGIPLPHVSISIRDGAGTPLPTGELGDIWVGPAENGPWAGQYRGSVGACFATGDIGSLDDGGALHVVGRSGDVITRGGVTVAAAELEAILGDVAGVRAVAVVGRPHERLGEQIVALVEPEAGRHLDAVTVREHAAAMLSHGKVPDEVHVVDMLPRNAMGKVAKAELRRDFS